MNNTKKIILSSLLVASVTTVQADGFLNKLLGSSSGGADFKTLIAHVPADTPYIFTNKNPLPEEVMDFHLSRGQEIMKMVTSLENKSKAKDDSEGIEAFFASFLKDVTTKMSEKKLEESGLSLKTTTMVYGLGVSPVIRLGIADKEKLMATIKRAEEKSKYKVEFTKCGDYDCFVDTKDDNSIAVVILKDHIAASFFPAKEKDKFIAHLTGKSSPKEAYGTDKWDAFLKENNYKGFGEGFIDLKSLSTTLKPMIMEGIAGKSDPKDLEGCMAVAQDHINNVPEIVMGTKKLDVKNMDYEVVVKTSSDVSTSLQTIANKTNIAQHVVDPIFDFGLNINFMNLREALNQYSNFLINSGEKNKCKSIDPKEIRKGMGGMMMAMNMGLTQFKSVYGSISNIDLDDKMNPTNVDAYISLGTADPAGLLGMVSMMSPALMGFQVPADGSVVKLPKGAIPSKGKPLPPVYLSRSAKSLNIMIGNDKPVLKDYKNATPEISSFSMNGKRYYQKISEVMKAIPKSKGKGAEDEDVFKMMTAVGDMMGIYNQEITADKRGLVINYHVNYK